MNPPASVSAWEIADARPDFALMAPRLQKVHMLGWICRARGLDEQYAGEHKVAMLVRRIAHELTNISKIMWPGSVQALQMNARPDCVVGELGIKAALLPRTWNDASEFVQTHRERAMQSDVPLDDYGWADDLRCPAHGDARQVLHDAQLLVEELSARRRHPPRRRSPPPSPPPRPQVPPAKRPHVRRTRARARLRQHQARPHRPRPGGGRGRVARRPRPRPRPRQVGPVRQQPRRPRPQGQLEDQLGLDISWCDGNPRKVQAQCESIARRSYDLVLIATGFQAHTIDGILARAARAGGVPDARVFKGRPLACIRALARSLGMQEG
ncbi:hypothetical protein [Nannocystis sp.]|uniref:hypothetical protein n=1 Tax=Nannocystis sp. TaxID=1962667 RepID=UPI0025DBF56C|nr:hypothetical protein [Nannocystis sp.]MBK7828617.1 hypothetical protein [Nannocystis sp.]